MTKLCVCIDGSECSLHALKHALRRTIECPSTTLLLITVQPEPVVYGEIEVYVTHERMAELQRLHSTDILKPAEEIARKAGATVATEIAVGDIAPTLVRRAEQHQCDEIIMGTRGMNAVGNLVFGSVANKVVHIATVPVTLVR